MSTGINSNDSPRKKSIRLMYLIYPKFQLTLIGLYSLLLAGIFGSIVYQLKASISRLEHLATQAHLPTNHPFFNFVNEESALLQQNVGLTLIAGLVLMTIVTIYVSHKLAGPIVRMKSYFSRLASNPIRPFMVLKFRNGDFFSDLPEKVNQALDKISAK